MVPPRPLPGRARPPADKTGENGLDVDEVASFTPGNVAAGGSQMQCRLPGPEAWALPRGQS